jgi:hypothetical protein
LGWVSVAPWAAFTSAPTEEALDPLCPNEQAASSVGSKSSKKQIRYTGLMRCMGNSFALIWPFGQEAVTSVANLSPPVALEGCLRAPLGTSDNDLGNSYNHPYNREACTDAAPKCDAPHSDDARSMGVAQIIPMAIA